MTTSFAIARKITGLLLYSTAFLIGIFVLTVAFRFGYHYGVKDNLCDPPILPPPNKPNFVVFLADDLGYGDLSSYGHPTIRTPNIDTMVFNGMKLTQFYVNPMCSPTRSALLTGRDPIRNGAYNGEDPTLGRVIPVFYPPSYGMLPQSEILVTDILRDQGYFSGVFGKWHLGSINSTALPLQRGFDRFWGVPYSTDIGCPPGIGYPCAPTAGPAEEWTPVPLYRGNDIIEQPTTFPDFMPRMTAEAVYFLEEAKYFNQPFFLYVPFVSPHLPLFTAPEFYNVSTRGLYGDVIEEIDNTVGIIVNKLKELGLDENTLVVFTSDNGPSTYFREMGGSSGLLRGTKGTTYEGGVRVPSVFYWPGRIKKNSINQSITSVTDLFTTMIDLAGGQIPTDRVIDGMDLSPVLFENQNLGRQCIPYYTQRVLAAVRCGSYKIHYYAKQTMVSALEPVIPNQLYNLDVDPSELYALNLTLYANVIQEIENYLEYDYYPYLIPGPPQFEFYNDTVGSYQPCCTDDITNCFCPPRRTFGPDVELQQLYYSNQLDQLLAEIDPILLH